jgi:hypothetical protein
MAKRAAAPVFIAPEPEPPDFETRVRDGAYETKLSYADNRQAAREDSNRLCSQFMTDLTAYLVTSGVPARYASKVASYAWSEGHSCGYSEVVIHASNLADIFQD